MLSAGAQHRMTRSERRDLRNALLFVSPWLVGFGVFLAYPIGMSLYYSLCDFSVLQPARFIGLANYRQLAADDVFLQALTNTFIYAAGAIPLSVVLALTISMLLNTGVRGMAIYRTIYFLPSLVPSVAMAILWLWLLNGKNGILNYLIRQVSAPLSWALLLVVFASPALLAGLLATWAGDNPGRQMLWGCLGFAVGVGVVLVAWHSGALAKLGAVRDGPPSWLSDTFWAKPALIFMSLWGTGQAVVIYLAGLQEVPDQLYEAADLDGANWWQKIRNVTLPMISPVILFNGIMSIIGTFNFFAIPFVMAPGGQPARSAYFLAVNLYDNVFQFFRMGYACAMAWILFLVVFGLTMLAMKISERHVFYGGA
jgi:multiple sugar transport system permease protein